MLGLAPAICGRLPSALILLMNVSQRYWTQVRIDSGGDRRVTEIAPVKAFFKGQFSSLEPDVSNAFLQRHLLQILQHSPGSSEAALAECSLRCFISHQINLACAGLAKDFGSRAGFSHQDLLPLVLDDVECDRAGVSKPYGLAPPAEGFQPFASRVLQSFDPDKAELSTWTKRRVTSHPDLSRFLESCGVRLISDWALLNDGKLTPARLAALLSGVYNVPTTASSVQAGCQLLEAFHAVYRRDRRPRQPGTSRSRCGPPSAEQLSEMITWLQTQQARPYTPEALLKALKALAQTVRRAHAPQMVSFDQSEMPDQLDYQISMGRGAGGELGGDLGGDLDDDPENPPMQQFLQRYRQAFQHCLESSIAQSVSSHLAHHRKKRKPTATEFLQGLCLTYCQQWPMGKIAPQVGLTKQYQVSRLLDLGGLRAAVRHHMLQGLGDRLREWALSKTDPIERVQELDRKLDELLGAEVDKVLDADRASSFSGQSKRDAHEMPEHPCIPQAPLKQVFADRLCHYLHTLSL